MGTIMPDKRRNNLKVRIRERIQHSPDRVFIWADFADLEVLQKESIELKIRPTLI